MFPTCNRCVSSLSHASFLISSNNIWFSTLTSLAISLPGTYIQCSSITSLWLIYSHSCGDVILPTCSTTVSPVVWCNPKTNSSRLRLLLLTTPSHVNNWRLSSASPRPSSTYSIWEMLLTVIIYTHTDLYFHHLHFLNRIAVIELLYPALTDSENINIVINSLQWPEERAEIKSKLNIQ